MLLICCFTFQFYCTLNVRSELFVENSGSDRTDPLKHKFLPQVWMFCIIMQCVWNMCILIMFIHLCKGFPSLFDF